MSKKERIKQLEISLAQLRLKKRELMTEYRELRAERARLNFTNHIETASPEEIEKIMRACGFWKEED